VSLNVSPCTAKATVGDGAAARVQRAADALRLPPNLPRATSAAAGAAAPHDRASCWKRPRPPVLSRLACTAELKSRTRPRIRVFPPSVDGKTPARAGARTRLVTEGGRLEIIRSRPGDIRATPLPTSSAPVLKSRVCGPAAAAASSRRGQSDNAFARRRRQAPDRLGHRGSFPELYGGSRAAADRSPAYSEALTASGIELDERGFVSDLANGRRRRSGRPARLLSFEADSAVFAAIT